ncbi:MAG: DUF4405 domain-containing protein [Paenirhodobacter sp.]|uniref:DUF4405 domain-containing protein n=1 Tax=Paenirhodobacter sp. TaxID=1965326 RepID=UPI003D14D3B5
MFAHVRDTTRSTAATRFSGRAFAVFLIGLAFLAMTVSGGALMLAPSGRIAAQGGWSFLGLGRSGWEGLHLTMALLVIGAALWHGWLHRAVIVNLAWSRATQGLGHPREIALALGLVVLVIVLAALHLPPASWLETLAASFRHDLW